MIGPNTALYCLEVGQGAAAAVLEPHPDIPSVNQAAVIDVGESGTRLARWLNDCGVERITGIILTHNDADHIGSLAQLVEAYKGKIKKLYFVVDRKEAPKFWTPAEQWERKGWVHEVDVCRPPLSSRDSPGGLLLGPEDGCSFRLYCAFPPTLLSFNPAGLPADITPVLSSWAE